MKKIILASSSPRRKDILTKLQLEFEIIPSDYEEILDNFDFTYEKIEDLAFNKALSTSLGINYSALVIGADTVVVLEGKILGKPSSTKEAKEMLKALSGKKHSVVTSICVINTDNQEKKIVSTTSEVVFENLTKEQIDYYVETFNPLDKAGSYGIQEMPEGYVKEIQGSLENIIGLCPLGLKEALRLF